ncbi:MAG: hypothetical protein ACRC41_06660 [Sarcina sp.]
MFFINSNFGPKTQMTINLAKGLILALFVVLNYMFFNLNNYVFLVIFVGLIIIMELLTKFAKKKFLW